jgi:hypothetical protein
MQQTEQPKKNRKWIIWVIGAILAWNNRLLWPGICGEFMDQKASPGFFKDYQRRRTEAGLIILSILIGGYLVYTLVVWAIFYATNGGN